MNPSRSPRSFSRRSLSMVMALLMVAFVSPTVEAGSSHTVAQAMDLRSEFGLPASRSVVEPLLGSKRDVGSGPYGIPMTDAEVRAVDPAGRAEFSRDVRRDVLPWLEKQAKYAGAWLDQKDDGQLVVALTGPKPSVIAGIDARMPSGKRGWRMVQAEYTWDQLEAAVEDVWETRTKVNGGSSLVFSAVDVEKNRIILEFPSGKVASARSAKGAWADMLGVTVRIEAGHAPVDTNICSKGGPNFKQKNCWKPIPAGVETHSFSVTGRMCTMGFQVHKAGATPPNQWLTAGHCVHPFGKNGVTYGNKKVWHNANFHGSQNMGKRKKTAYEKTHKRDVARVSLDFTVETTDKLWNRPNGTVGPHEAVLDNDVVFYLGAGRRGAASGMIKHASTCWQSEAWAYNHSGNKLQVCGAQMQDVVSLGGDSGGPVYTQVPIFGGKYIGPVGIVSGNKPDKNGSLVFTKLTWVFDHWSGWEIRTTGSN